MARFDTPLGRLAGAVLSWAVFAYAFLGIYQVGAIVMGLGGSCASGGPFQIEAECPESVIWFAPGGMFGLFLALGLSFLARGFGVALVAWGWPILFIGLGIEFLAGMTSGQGIAVNIVCGLLFVIMGAGPVWFVLTNKILVPTLVGSRSITGERFAYDGKARRYFGLKPTEGDAETTPTAGDWAISLGVWVASVGLGAWLSLLTFAALAG
jgi:hypothetical protein